MQARGLKVGESIPKAEGDDGWGAGEGIALKVPSICNSGLETTQTSQREMSSRASPSTIKRTRPQGCHDWSIFFPFIKYSLPEFAE